MLEFVFNGGGGKYFYVVDDVVKAFFEAIIVAECVMFEFEGGVW